MTTQASGPGRPASGLKLDIGCGTNKRGPEWHGVDQFAMPGVDSVFRIGETRWPFEDNSVSEAFCSHFIEHLTNMGGKWERVHFFNELFRVLAPGAACKLIFPHWASNRFYGDPTHCEPFSEMGFLYLNREWRMAQAPHTDKAWNPSGYDCNFQATWGYALEPTLKTRKKADQEFALQNFKEAAQDIIAELIARK